jgi:hypothetical protein
LWGGSARSAGVGVLNARKILSITLQVSIDIRIPESQNSKSLGSKERIALAVRLKALNHSMLTAIYLDDNSSAE